MQRQTPSQSRVDGKLAGAGGTPGPSRRYPSAECRAALVAAVSCEGGRRGQPSLAALVDGCDQEELASIAIAQGVAGRAYERLGPLLAPPSRLRLRTQAQFGSVKHLNHVASLSAVAGTLDGVALDWAVLKGPVLAELSYGPTPRGYSDLDILVPAHQLKAAIQALMAIRGSLAENLWPELLSEAKGEVLVTLKGRSMIDLHWHLVSEGRARHRYKVPSDEILERRQRTELANVGAWVLEPTDFCAHVALHATFSGAHRLSWLLDIERTIANRPPDWDTLIARCRDWKIALPVSVALSRARQTLGAAVPPTVIHALAGSHFRRMVVDKLSDWVPAGNMPGGRSVRNGIARSLRDDLVATGGQFIEESWETLLDLARGDRTRGARKPLGPDGDAADFNRYINMVEGADPYGHISRSTRRK